MLRLGSAFRRPVFRGRDHRQRGVLHDRFGDAVERDVPDRRVHGDVALGNVPANRFRGRDRAHHDLGHEVGQRPNDRAREVGAVRTTDADRAGDSPSANLSRTTLVPPSIISSAASWRERSASACQHGAGSLGNVRARHVGPGNVVRFQGQVDDPRRRARARQHVCDEPGLLALGVHRHEQRYGRSRLVHEDPTRRAWPETHRVTDIPAKSDWRRPIGTGAIVAAEAAAAGALPQAGHVAIEPAMAIVRANFGRRHGNALQSRDNSTRGSDADYARIRPGVEPRAATC